METLEFPYRPKARPVLLGTGFFALCAAAGVRAAMTNDRGLIINGLVELEVDGATRFWWVIAALALGFVAAGLYLLRLGSTQTVPVRLTATELSAPKFGFSRTPRVLPLREVVDVSVMEVQGQRFLAVVTPRGRLDIARSMLPDPRAFDALHAAVLERVGAARR